MATLSYEVLLREAEKLSSRDQLQLIQRLLERLRLEEGPNAPRPRWEDYAASAPYPLCGEDAQTWVTRTRRFS